MSKPIKFGSLFSGIGGLDLGLERAGMECRWQVENDAYCQRVLAKHWPTVPRYGDIRSLDTGELERVDLICGGFPCQPVSVAGKRLAQEDERWLWPEFARIVRELRPRFVLVENVPGLLVRGMGDVLRDLAESGYDAEWGCISAAAVGAPHLRDRVWIVAHASRERVGFKSKRLTERESTPITNRNGAAQSLAYSEGEPIRPGLCQGNTIQLRERRSSNGCGEGPSPNAASTGLEGNEPEVFSGQFDGLLAQRDWWTSEPDVGRVANGGPSRVDRLRGLGNAVVPQVAEWIGARIMHVERLSD